MPRRKTRSRVSFGNAGAVERGESQKQASPSFHEPLGNLAKRRRDSHISTTPAARGDGKKEKQKHGFPLSPPPPPHFSNPKHNIGGLSPPPTAALRAASPRHLKFGNIFS